MKTSSVQVLVATLGREAQGIDPDRWTRIMVTVSVRVELLSPVISTPGRTQAETLHLQRRQGRPDGVSLVAKVPIWGFILTLRLKV